MISDPDWAVRQAAFAALERLLLAHGGRLSWQDIARGFLYGDELVRFASKPRGMFKPKQMSSANHQAWFSSQTKPAYGYRKFSYAGEDKPRPYGGSRPSSV